MEKTIKSLNIVAAAMLIMNLGVELWDRFRPQKQTKDDYQAKQKIMAGISENETAAEVINKPF